MRAFCRRAFFGCSAKLKKFFKANIIEILVLIICIPRKINFPIAIDQSYVSKSGKKIDYIGRFWSGCASAFKHGLEILGIAVADADIKDAMMLRSVQTLNASELNSKDLTLSEWYISILNKYSSELLKITSLL